jgi:hypothetical protein
MKRLMIGGLMLMLSACTPAEQDYCARMGTPGGHPENQKCLNYYFTQTAAFNADHAACSFEADKTYPHTLYDRGSTGWVRGGYGPYGTYYGGHTIHMSPDYRHNSLVDSLRMRVIAPCMSERGWRDPRNWEAGRLTPGEKPAMLPWLGK